MRQYIDIVQQVLDKGHWKSPIRMVDGKAVPVDGGVRTKACANVHFSHDMSDGFPLLTTKKMAHKNIRVELEGFIRGITSKRWYQERGCHIWDSWANPILVERYVRERAYGCNSKFKESVRREIQQELDDIGPSYGYQWRRFGEVYDAEDDAPNKGADQLKTIVDTLHTNYNDRRMVCSAWNPNHLSRVALPACPWGWNITVIGDQLHLSWIQRSADLMLGVPFDIASMATLQLLLCKEVGLPPGNLSGLLVDCHIYENHLDKAKEQVTRQPRQLPTCTIPDPLLTEFSIFDWTYDQFTLGGYNPHPKIDFGKVTV